MHEKDVKERAEGFLLVLCLLVLATGVCLALFCRTIEQKQEIAALKQEKEEQGHTIEVLRGIIRKVANGEMVPPDQMEENAAPPAEENPETEEEPTDTEAAGLDQDMSIRGYYERDFAGPHLDMVNRVERYLLSMGANITTDEVRYCCSLAWASGYDPRLWAVISAAESTCGRHSDNLYGFCGGQSGPWARPSGGWKEQTAWLDSRITTFYSRSVDITKPENVLWFHHEGEPLNGRNPYDLFYVRNVMNWLEAI